MPKDSLIAQSMSELAYDLLFQRSVVRPVCMLTKKWPLRMPMASEVTFDL